MFDASKVPATCGKSIVCLIFVSDTTLLCRYDIYIYALSQCSSMTKNHELKPYRLPLPLLTAAPPYIRCVLVKFFVRNWSFSLLASSCSCLRHHPTPSSTLANIRRIAAVKSNVLFMSLVTRRGVHRNSNWMWEIYISNYILYTIFFCFSALFLSILSSEATTVGRVCVAGKCDKVECRERR